jgi:hypothetical protein
VKFVDHEEESSEPHQSQRRKNFIDHQAERVNFINHKEERSELYQSQRRKK